MYYTASFTSKGVTAGLPYYKRSNGTFLDDDGKDRRWNYHSWSEEPLTTMVLKLVGPYNGINVTSGDTYHIIGNHFRGDDGKYLNSHLFVWDDIPEICEHEVKIEDKTRCDRNFYRCGKTMCHRSDCLDCWPDAATMIMEGFDDFDVDGTWPSETLKDTVRFEDKSAARKATPVFSGFCKYFPLAMQEVARLSKTGNDKHNPGEPLHWAKEKSTDHADCLIRHQLEFDQIDPDTGHLHAVSVAWRAMAQLETLLEAE